MKFYKNIEIFFLLMKTERKNYCMFLVSMVIIVLWLEIDTLSNLVY